MLAAFERASRRRGQRRTDDARAALLKNLKLTDDTLVTTSCSSAAARYLLSSADLSRLDATPIGEGVVARDVGRMLRATYYVRALLNGFFCSKDFCFFFFEGAGPISVESQPEASLASRSHQATAQRSSSAIHQPT